jgi:glycosyltransferase involved in cell wall biosynthesis
MNEVAIFVITYNRLNTLTKTLEAYKKFTTPHEVIIIDNGTDNPKCISLLNELKNTYKIYNLKKIESLSDLDTNINEAVKNYYDNNSTPYFAVADADVCFDIANQDTLDVYIELSKNLSCTVGPDLICNDLCQNYPLRGYVIRKNHWMLKKAYRSNFNYKNQSVSYINAPIDTTFVLFTRSPEFKRLKTYTIRVNKPYAARHLDWYIDILNPSEENLIYINKECLIGSYGGSYIKGFFNIFRRSKEEALSYLQNEVSCRLQNHKDAILESYMLSWMYQFGHGCNIDIEKSIYYLINADPHGATGTEHANGIHHCSNNNLLEMVFNNNFDCLNK